MPCTMLVLYEVHGVSFRVWASLECTGMVIARRLVSLPTLDGLTLEQKGFGGLFQQFG
jgi:hypothetical protein